MRKGYLVAAAYLALLGGTPHAAGQELLELGFEQLMDMEVSTVSRKSQTLSRTAAAAYVISREDIRRSGASSLPEALRLAPGVHVAQISASKWSVSIRGFGGRFANKLLVLMDGRTVYTPAFAGTYWEMQDLMLEDIERIEVIRGPGATLWGANAVNGIINIITRHSDNTREGVTSASLGSGERSLGYRHGGAIGSDGAYRVYAKTTHADALQDSAGLDLDDGFARHQAGFRADWLGDQRNQFSLHGHVQHLRQGQTLEVPLLSPPAASTGWLHETVKTDSASLVGRWQHSLAVDSEISLQVYFDHYDRDELAFGETRNTFDLDFQHQFAWGELHQLIWGLGYRRSHDDFDSDPALAMAAMQSKTLTTLSTFVQDEIELANDRLWLTLGTKLEHNSYTGNEWQPSARLLWAPSGHHSLWASVSRAVRTPSRGETGMAINYELLPVGSPSNPTGPFPVLTQQRENLGMDAEKLTAFEVGARWQPDPGLTLDLAAYYNRYKDLRSPELLAQDLSALPLYVIQPNTLINDEYGETYGVELAGDWRVSDAWRLQLAWSLFEAHLRLDNAAAIPYDATLLDERNTPQQIASLRSSWSPRGDLDVDLWLRYTSDVGIPSPGSQIIPDPVAPDLGLDARLAWRPTKDLELALVGKNLLDPTHEEAEQEVWPVRSEIARSVSLNMQLSF